MVALGLIPALATLNALEPARPPVRWRGPWLPVLRMLALALPLALVGFLFIPRLSAPCGARHPDGPARTGVSGSMAPGDFTQLLVDDSPAFRVSFDGPPGRRARQRYFRGPVLWRFDGRTWSTAHNASSRTCRRRDATRRPNRWTHGAACYAYQVTLEPTQQHWLFALDTPLAAPDGRAFHPRPHPASRQAHPLGVTLSRCARATQHVLSPGLCAARRAGARCSCPQGFDPRARDPGRALATALRRTGRRPSSMPR